MKKLALALLSLGLSSGISDAATRYVSASSLTPVSPYTNWMTAAATIQSALDVAVPGDEVLVTNGLYATGARVFGTSLLSNRVVVSNAVTVRSVNGADVTTIQGAVTNVVRGVYLAAGATLEGFAVQGSSSLKDSFNYGGDYSGGGIFCASTSAYVRNCRITGNFANTGGGVVGGTLADCEITGNNAWFYGGGVVNCTLSNCALVANSVGKGSGSGGGATTSYLVDCRVERNYAREGGGGGADACTLIRCVVISNSAYASFAGPGGGIRASTAFSCQIEGNSGYGGGAAYSLLYSCALVANKSVDYPAFSGTAAVNCTLNNCTVINHGQNSALHLCSATNCIVYFNNVNYESDCTFSFSCTTPLPPGPGNITNDPRLVSAVSARLLPGSPCINAGTNLAWMAGAQDWENESRLFGTVDMGADEFIESGLTGVLSVAATAAPAQVAAGYAIDFAGAISGKVAGFLWDFGDGVTTQNTMVIPHAYSSDGLRDVLFTASNADNRATATVRVDVVSFFHAAPGGSHQPPFKTWAQASTTIQAAVDAAYVGGTVLVSNGIYAVGGRVLPGSSLANRVVIDRALPVIAVGGPSVTIIEGALDPFDPSGLGNNASRCVYLTNGATLAGFTLRNGRTRMVDGAADLELSGGGVFCAGNNAVVSNCCMIGNRAYASGGGIFGGFVSDSQLSSNRAANGGAARGARMERCLVDFNYAGQGGGLSGGSGVDVRVIGNYAEAGGGGVFDATYNRIRLEGNQALQSGGGAQQATLYNALLVSNTASYGGGSYNSSLYACTLLTNQASQQGGGMWGGQADNSIIFFNSAPTGPNHYGASMTWSDTMPAPNGAGNIGADPQLSPTGDPVPLATSPCRDAGLNRSWMGGSTELSGQPRIAAGRVDMGAFEFAPADTDGDGLGDDWEMTNFGNLTNASSTSDYDVDGATDSDEYRAGTQPTNNASQFETFVPGTDNPLGSAITVYWQSAPGRTYRLDRSTNLLSSFSIITGGVVATPPANTYIDSSVSGNGPWVYRAALDP